MVERGTLLFCTGHFKMESFFRAGEFLVRLLHSILASKAIDQNFPPHKAKKRLLYMFTRR